MKKNNLICFSSAPWKSIVPRQRRFRTLTWDVLLVVCYICLTYTTGMLVIVCINPEWNEIKINCTLFMTAVSFVQVFLQCKWRLCHIDSLNGQLKCVNLKFWTCNSSHNYQDQSSIHCSTPERIQRGVQFMAKIECGPFSFMIHSTGNMKWAKQKKEDSVFLWQFQSCQLKYMSTSEGEQKKLSENSEEGVTLGCPPLWW